MCFIRYRGKSEKDFKLFPCDDIGCSVYYLKQFLMSKSASRRSKDEIDFIITDASTKEEYQNDSDLIPRYTSVIVVRRPREIFEPLTPETTQRQVISFDNIINGSDSNLPSGFQKSLDQTIKPTSYVCHNCKRCGHTKRYCPLLIGSSTAKMSGTIDSAHKSAINVTPPASISAVRPHSYLINNKNTVLCSVNDTSIKEPLSNKTQTSIDTRHAEPVSLSSTFSSSNIFFQQPPLKFVIDSLSEDDDDEKLIQIRSVQPLARPSHIVSRSSPYQLPYGRAHRLSISETRTTIPRDNLNAIPREITGVIQDKWLK